MRNETEDQRVQGPEGRGGESENTNVKNYKDHERDDTSPWTRPPGRRTGKRRGRGTNPREVNLRDGERHRKSE